MSEAHRTPRSHGGERGGGGPERKVSGFAAPLGELGFDGAKPTCHTDPALRRCSSPNGNGGEERLVFATPKEPCTTQPVKTSLDLCSGLFVVPILLDLLELLRAV